MFGICKISQHLVGARKTKCFFMIEKKFDPTIVLHERMNLVKTISSKKIKGKSLEPPSS
jgi:hypothetical protein